MQMLTKICRKL